MSYLTFHFVFTIPPILLMAATLPQPLAGMGDIRAKIAIPLLCLIAFTYTTPWDNYLVAREVWWYGPERVVATIGYVPVEEYLFFLLQPILTGLFVYHYLSRWRSDPGTISSRSSTGARIGGGVLFGGITAFAFAVLASGWEAGLYMALVLGWASPVLLGMWIYGGSVLWRERKTLLVAVGIPTVYLWVADGMAIHLGIWTISDTYTLGVEPLGLPVEEATFFLMTNLLVVKGILLFLYGDHDAVVKAAPQELRTPAASS